MSTLLNNCYLVKVSTKGKGWVKNTKKKITQTFKQHSPRKFPPIIRRFQRFGSMLSIISVSGENVLYELILNYFSSHRQEFITFN